MCDRMAEKGLMEYLIIKEYTGKQNHRGIYKYCNYCDKLFFIPIFRLKQGKGQFCCRKCSSHYKLYKHKKEECEMDYIFCRKEKHGQIHRGFYKKCENCGDLFFVRIMELQENRGRYCSRKCKGKIQSKIYIGEHGNNWKGGITTLTTAFRNSQEYADWRISCMARDDFTCQECGKNGVMLNVHHTKSVKDIFEEYDIKTRDDYMNCEELWNLNNGITLCVDCHKEIHWGKP